MEALKRNITKLDEFQHRKYVSYWDKYEKEIYLSMDLHTMFLNTQIDILKAQKIGDYLFWKGAENQKPFQKFLEKEVKREDVLEFICPILVSSMIS